MRPLNINVGFELLAVAIELVFKLLDVIFEVRTTVVIILHIIIASFCIDELKFFLSEAIRAVVAVLARSKAQSNDSNS